MKQFIRLISVLLVLLMTVTVMTACKDDGKNNENPKDSERETETEREAETEHELSREELDQLKADMSESILEALDKVEGETTESDSEEETTEYAGIVEGILGSLGGLGNGDYDYSQIIGEVLDQYIGSSSTSSFIKGLIKSWLKDKFGASMPDNGSGEQSTEEQTTEEQLPENDADALREYIAQKTAEAISDAIVERINEVANGTLRDSIYESVYNAMKGNEGFMNGILEEKIPGYGELSGLLGGFTQ